jgi:alpha-D-xyloside xylohydrolase
MRSTRTLAIFVLSIALSTVFVRAQEPAEVVEFTRDRMLLRFSPAEGSFELTVFDAEGAAVSTTPVPGFYADGAHEAAFESTDRPGSYRSGKLLLSIEPVDGRALALTVSTRSGEPHQLRLRLRSDDETRYYGTGERFQSLNQRGFILPIRVDDRYGNKGVGTHKPVPFFMSSKGFGVWLDSFAPAEFDLSGTARFDTDIEMRGSSMRVVFIAGPRLDEILETFTGLTGRSPVPPAWAFGLWKSRDVHRNREDVLEDVEKLRRFGIPASVLVIDSPWETGYNDFNMNRAQFSDPEALFRRVEELGFNLALWLTPMINVRNVIDMEGIEAKTATFDEAAAKGVLVETSDGEVALTEWWKGTGGLVDFTDPAAKAWWFEQLAKTKKWGVKAFKCDDGEGNFVPEAVFADGTPASLMKNRYSDLYNGAMQEYVDKELGGNGVLIVRSGFTGVQKYPFAWAGDNYADFSFDDGLPSVVVAGQNAALSGISLWGSDIAGYAGTPDKELFIRWSQFATFVPFMQIHMTSNLGPWDFDEETLEIFREFAVLRSQLFPYLYEAVHQTARTGMPVIRPMVLAFPEDREAHKQIHQYMFGPDLLVAPMISRGTSRSVYLPAGDWYDYWTRELHEGPVTVETAAPLSRIPLFVRSGAILPMLPADVQTLVSRHPLMDSSISAIDGRRSLEVWPGRGAGLATWDGLRARIDGSSLLIESDRERAVEIRLVGRRPGSEIDGATFTPEGAGATLRFERLRRVSIPLE